MKKDVTKFVPRNVFPDYRVTLSDFKGHHVKALNKMKQIGPQLDLIFEMRDSRAPLSSKNVLIDKFLPIRTSKIILYSKCDLSSINLDLLKRWHSLQNEQFMFIDCRSSKDSEILIELAKQKFQETKPPLGLRMMIVGMPNVGKSTLVNTLRYTGSSSNSKKVAKTGGQPGVTRATSSIIKINETPEILLYDTPGVFLPRVSNSKQMIILNLIGAVKSNLVDPVIQADYLLYLINLQGDYDIYKEFLPYPTNDINVLLKAISKKIGKFHKNGYDDVGSAIHWIDKFKQGKIKRRINFEEELILEDYNFKYNEFMANEKKRVEDMNISVKKSTKRKPLTHKEAIVKNVNQLF